MLPKKIVMENFGPFVCEKVDFTHFFETPLFLICGKTGAGKTTIFDAITFALFGDASGGVRNASEIRSTFADPMEETKVKFYFEHQGRQFVIERSPKQVISKKNGKGETTKNQKVQLIVLDAEGKEVEAYQKIEPVNDMIYRMLHLNKDQFRQIAMLPQGEFRTFLVANSSEKEAVLRSLFGTSIYRTFTEELKAQKQKLEKAVNEVLVRIDQLFQQVVTEKGDTYQESLEIAQKHLTTEKQRVQAVQKELSDKKSEYKKQQGLLTEAEQLTLKFKQFNEVQKEVQLLNEQEPSMMKKREIVDQGKKILQLLPLYTHLQELKQNNQQLDQQIAVTQEAIKKNTGKQQELQQQAKAFESEQTLWQAKEAQCQEWKTALPFVIQKEELEAQQRQQLRVKKELQQECDQITAIIKETALQMTELKKQQETETFWQERRFQEMQFNQHIEKLLQEQRQLNQQEEQLEDQQIQMAVLIDKISQVSNKLVEQATELKMKKSRWASLEIARLSQELLPGEPCPVCGSLDHPRPADNESISSEEFKLLQVQLEKTDEAVKQLQIQKETAENELRLNSNKYELAQKECNLQTISFQKNSDSLTKKVAAYYNEPVELPFEKLEAYLIARRVQTDQKLAGIGTAKQELVQLEGVYQQLQKDYEESLSKLRASENLLQLLTGRLQTAIEQTKDWQAVLLEKDIKALEESIIKRQKLIEVHQHETQLVHTEKIRLTESLSQLMNQKKSLEIDQQQKMTSFSETLLNLGVKQSAVEEQYTKPQDFSGVEEELQTYDNARLLAQDRLQQLETAVARKKCPDLKLIRKQTAELETIVHEVQEAFFQKDLQLKQLEQILQQIEELNHKSSQQLEELAELTELFRTMNGDNAAKISLERFILQWYLSEVLRTANQQLTLLTNGRYQFELNQQTGRSKGNTGLEINIYDDNIGASRSAHTLSGGESFIAALALALGLAEVIQNQSGGIAMETLFIDEGFGSLDEEALEMAISALEGIESQGRMIGIISHVRELKERITQQVIIQTSGTGQSTICYQLEGWERH